MLTDPGDLVVDPFGGSCVTGAVSERLCRNWVCCDKNEEYLLGAVGRFIDIDADSEQFEKNREYVIRAPNFKFLKSPKNVPLALQEQLELFTIKSDE